MRVARSQLRPAGHVILKEKFEENFNKSSNRIIAHCIALHCIALHCIALHCIALHCIVIK
jgi:hypothetical protein